MTSMALPNPTVPASRPSGTRRWYIWPAASLIALVALAAVWGGSRISAGPGKLATAGKFFTVSATDLDIKVRKDGELQAVNNVDVTCMVEGRSTMVYLVKEGENVKKGDLLVEIDSSTLRQSLQTATLEVKQADSDLRNSKEMLAIQENQNAADLQAAQVELDLAKLALQQYEDGTYPQELADAETLVKMTQITVRNKEEDLEQTKALFAKGFVTAADVKQAELSVTTVHNDLRKAQTALMVLTKYKNPTDLATNRSAVSQAEQKLARVKRTNASMLIKSQADVDTKEIALATKAKNLNKLEQQLEYCKITAPGDGMVVYSRDDDDFRMVEGAQVRERQRLIRLPDTSQMKAVVKIGESQVPRLRIGQRGLVKIVGVPDPVGATVTRISPMADGSSRWWNPELREYPVELVIDRTAPDMKPGLSLQCEIFVEQLRDVTAVPLASIYSQGRDSFVFARRGDDVQPVKVQIGGASETHAHITEGLAIGADVLVLAAGQGRQLLERAGIAADDPMQRDPGAAPPAGAEQTTTAVRDATDPKRDTREGAGDEKVKGEASARGNAPGPGRDAGRDGAADRAGERTSDRGAERTGDSRSAAPGRETTSVAPASPTVALPVNPAVRDTP